MKGFKKHLFTIGLAVVLSVATLITLACFGTLTSIFVFGNDSDYGVALWTVRFQQLVIFALILFALEKGIKNNKKNFGGMI